MKYTLEFKLECVDKYKKRCVILDTSINFTL